MGIPGTEPANSKANGGTRGNGGTDITGTSATGTTEVAIERRIVATLRPVPGGMSPGDLIRAIKNDRGCTPPMIQASSDHLLVSRVIGKVNGRLVAGGGVA